MNHIFKSLYNQALGTWVAVPEIAKSHGKTSRIKRAAVALDGKSFAYTALASAMLLVGSEAGAAGVGDGTGTNAIILFPNNPAVSPTASGADSFAVGTKAKADGSGAFALGVNSVASGTSAYALGNQAKADKTDSVALGTKASATGNSAFAIGANATASATNSLAFGNNGVTASANNALALGHAAKATTTSAIAMGDGATVEAGGTSPQQTAVAGVAIGKSAQVTSLDSIALGASASASGGTGATAVGRTAKATHEGASAYGYSAKASGWVSTAVGYGTLASGQSSVAVGRSSEATGQESMASGYKSQATGAAAIAIGSQAKSLSRDATAIGTSANAAGQDGIAVGNAANAAGKGVVAIGTRAGMGLSPTDPKYVAPTDAVFIGSSAGHGSNNNRRQIAIGNNAGKDVGSKGGAATENIAIGNEAGSGVNGNTNVAISSRAGLNVEGADNFAALIEAGQNVKGKNNIAIGKYAGRSARADAPLTVNDTIALGFEALGTDNDTIALGRGSKAQVADSIAIGRGVTTELLPGDGPNDREGMIAIGSETTKASGKAAVSIGRNAQGIGRGTVALGDASKALAGQGIAIGNSAEVRVTQGVALGSSSVARVDKNQEGVDPLKAGFTNNSTWKATHAAVSVGNGTTVTRQITSVAAGTQDTDAVNVAQLKAAGFKLTTSGSAGEVSGTTEEKVQNGETVTVDAGKNIKITQDVNKITVATQDKVAFTQITLGDTTNNTVLTSTANGLDIGGDKITNVAAGTAGTDAVNVDQLSQAINNINSNVNAAKTQVKSDNKTVAINKTQDATTGADIYDLAINTGNSLTVDATTGAINVKTDGTTITTDANGAIKANTIALGNEANGKVTAPSTADAGKLVTAGDIANAINNSGFTLKTSANGGSKTSGADEVINPGDVIDLAAGKNLEVKQEASGKVTYSLANKVDLGASGSLTAGNTVVNNDGIAINNPADPSKNVSLTGSGLNNGGNAITNVASNLPNTYSSAAGGNPITKAQALPTNVDAMKNNAATVGDILNAGWNVQTNGQPTDFVRAYDTINFADGNGTTITSKTDGSTTTFKVNVNAQALAETAQLPVVYTKADGTKVYKHSDGKFYDKPEGTPGAAEVPTADIIASMQNADGSTTNPTTLANVDAGVKDTDAVNVSQLKGAAAALGGGAGINPATGDFIAPSYTITKTDGSAYPVANNVGDALKNLNDEVVKPLTFKGNANNDTGGNGSQQVLGSELKIVGGLSDSETSSNRNIRTVVTDGQVDIQIADAPIFAGTVTAPTFVTSGNHAITMSGNTGTISGLTNTTLGAPDFASKGRAATEEQLNAAQNNLIGILGGNAVNNFGNVSFTNIGGTGKNNIHDAIQSVNTAATQAKTTVSAGPGVSVASNQNANGSTNYTVAVKTDNTTVTVNANGDIAAVTSGFSSVQNPNATGKITADTPSALATAGDIADAINNSGFTLTTSANGGTKDTASTQAEVINPGDVIDIAAGKNLEVKQEANGKVTLSTQDEVEFEQITIPKDPANTDPTKTDVVINQNGLDNGGNKIINVARGEAGTDAVNKDQLDEVASRPTHITNVDARTYNIINNTTVSAGDNMQVTKQGDNYKVALAPDITLNSVTTGGVVMNSNGLSVNGNTYVDAAGLNANGQTIRNVAAGRVAADSRDAVNGAQLHQAYQRMGDIDQRARAGIASAMASAGLPQAYRPGANMVAVSAGHYDGQSAVAIGASTISDNGRWILKGTLNVNSKDAGATVGVGYQW